MLTETEMRESLDALGLTLEDLQDRDKIQPMAVLMEQQMRAVMPDSLIVEAYYSSATGRKNVRGAAVEFLLLHGWDRNVADAAASAGFQDGLNLWDLRPELFSWFQQTIKQRPIYPNLPFILKNLIPSSNHHPSIQPLPKVEE